MSGRQHQAFTKFPTGSRSFSPTPWTVRIGFKEDATPLQKYIPKVPSTSYTITTLNQIHRFDLHVHSWYSADAADSPEAIIAAARKRGLSGIAITDHNTCEAHQYLREKGLEFEDGRAVENFLVIPGVEVSTNEGHLLCLGVLLPNLKHQPAAIVMEETRRRGGIAIPAHPFDRWRAGIRAPVLDRLPLTHLETFNSAITCKRYNERASAYARKRGLIMTASSDAHFASSVGTATTLLELDALNLPSVLAALSNKTTLQPGYLTPTEAIKKNFGNWFRKFLRKPRN